MNLIAAPGGKSLTDIAGSLLKINPAHATPTEKASIARIVAANQHLAESGEIPKGSVVLVPSEAPTQGATLAQPQIDGALGLIKLLQENLPHLSSKLHASFTTNLETEVESSGRILALEGAETPTIGVKPRAKGAKATAGKTTEKTSATLLAGVLAARRKQVLDDQKTTATALDQLGKELSEFLKQHSI